MPATTWRLGLSILGMAACLVLACEGGGNPGTEPSADSSQVESETSGAPGAPVTRWSQPTDAGRFDVALYPREGAVPLQRMHDWVVRITDPEGQPVEVTRVDVGGGMPQHGHGFVTSPRVTGSLGDGAYLIEGMRFHMSGDWQITIDVAAGAVADGTSFDIEVGP